MSRDSILDPYITSSHDFGNCVTPEDAKVAMDEYAKQQAIEFVKWAIENEKIIGDNWGDAFAPLDEEVLYIQFIEQQDKQE